jgi:hypothetical protein
MHEIIVLLPLFVWELWRFLHCVYGQIVFVNAVLGFMVLSVNYRLQVLVNRKNPFASSRLSR